MLAVNEEQRGVNDSAGRLDKSMVVSKSIVSSSTRWSVSESAALQSLCRAERLGRLSTNDTRKQNSNLG